MKLTHEKTWVVVTNGETARLFDFPGRGKALVPLPDHVWHAPEINEVADAQGVTHSSTGSSQHRMAAHTGPDRASDAFAEQISDKLAAALNSGAFERLVLIAAPRMLGLLRGKMDTKVQSSIWVEIDKDFAHMPLEEIDSALDQHLFS